MHGMARTRRLAGHGGGLGVRQRAVNISATPYREVSFAQLELQRSGRWARLRRMTHAQTSKGPR